MSKVSYANMKLKINEDTKIVKIGDMEVEVLQYLPFKDKHDLVAITLQNSIDQGVYDEMLLDMYFHLYIIYLYTNMGFTEKQKEDEFKLYDVLQSNNVIDTVLTAIPENEYTTLINCLNTQVEREMKYQTTAASVINKFVADLPKNAAAAEEIMKNFDTSQFQAVVDFAKAANGGRDI